MIISWKSSGSSALVREMLIMKLTENCLPIASICLSTGITSSSSATLDLHKVVKIDVLQIMVLGDDTAQKTYKFI